LGGGSSDAARTLLALDALDGAGWPAERLSPIAATLGSDVPFFVYGPSAVCTGRGEVVRPVAPPRPRWAVLVLPPIHMPTPAVYRQFDAMGLGRTRDIDVEPDWAAWTSMSSAELLPALVNDLEAPAFAISPGLGELRAGCERTVGRVVRMSGSGSSLFTLYDAEPEARDAAMRIGTNHGVRAEAVELCPAV
jgi:4-diphosphocytidyl-2-C-methyl-D-erythritol kinase